MIEVHDRPLITFALFAYNQEKYIREAVEGAFAQTYSPLEIILSDDCSTDGTFEIMKAMAASYRGPHKVVLNKNPFNYGIGRHVNRVMDLASGELIVFAAGDDISSANRTTAIYERWSADQEVIYLHSNLVAFCDESSKQDLFRVAKLNKHQSLTTCQDLIAAIRSCGPEVRGCTEACHRSLFEVFGPLPPDIISEDRALPFRAMLIGKVAYIEENLVRYRVNAESAWGQLISGDYFQSYAEDSRRRLMKLNQKLVVLSCFRKDLILAQQQSLISDDLATDALAAINAAVRLHRLKIIKQTGTLKMRIVAAIELHRHNTERRPTLRATLLDFIFAIAPSLHKRYYERRQRQLWRELPNNE